jgi:hypothetical protein
MPHQLAIDLYGTAPKFLWQSLKSGVTYNHKEIRDFYAGSEAASFRKTRSLMGLLSFEVANATKIWFGFFGPALTLPLVMVRRVLRDRRPRFLLLVGGVFLLGLAVEAFFSPHYAAAMTGLVLAVQLQAMRHLRTWRWSGAPSGRLMVNGIPLILLAMFGVHLAAKPLGLAQAWDGDVGWCSELGNVERARIESRLEKLPGGQLVIVRYQRDHNAKVEWVYNRADIDHAKVVWARDMGSKNEELIRYFKDRRVWLLDPDDRPPRLEPYSAPGSS